MFKDLVLKNRSYRRFHQEKEISCEQLKELAYLGHMTPSAANKQPVRFTLVYKEKDLKNVFDCVKWAGYLKDWDGPAEGERPTGYIILTAPEGLNCAQDEGIIAQTILLGAVDMGLGGCMIGNIDRNKLSDLITIPENHEIRLIIALGVPKEEIVIENIHADGDIKYYRDENQIHHVPKIDFHEVISY
ncbi:MAG: nitroreductase family protein [Lachnospira sp.]